MDSKEKEIAFNICSKIFEDMAFMFSEPVDDNQIDSGSETFIRTNMSYAGAKTGRIEIIVSLDLAKNLAMNMLGIDEPEDLEPDSIIDATKELLNTFCGNILTSVYNDDDIFDLTIPETSEINNAAWKSLLAGGEYLAVNIDEEPFLVKTEFN